MVWQDARNGVTDYNIYGQRVSASGTLLGDNFAMAATDGNQLEPAAAWNADKQRVPGGLGGCLTSTTSTASALPPMVNCWEVDSPFLLLPNQSAPALTWNSRANEYLVVWQDARNSAGGTQSDLYGPADRSKRCSHR